MKKKIVLFAPEAYQRLSPSQKEKICNGCGSKGGLNVPDTMYGLDMSEPCQIHDFMYHVGKTNADKEEADRTFLNNMNRVIEARSWRFLKPLRYARAKEYYIAVKYFGGSAFWKGKNNPLDLVHLP